MFRPEQFDWQIPLHFRAASVGGLVFGLPSGKQRIGTLEASLRGFLPQIVSLPANADRVLAELRPEAFLDEQDGLERRDIDVIEQPVETPAHTLAGQPEGLMNLIAVCAAEDHVAGLARPQFDLQLMRFHQLLQGLQELLVFLGQFHVVSPQ